MSQGTNEYTSNQDTGIDGAGHEKTVYGQAVRIYARNVAQMRGTKIRVTGVHSGATWLIDVVVKTGTKRLTEEPFPFLGLPDFTYLEETVGN